MEDFNLDSPTPKQRERMDAFFATLFALNSREHAAIENVIPMTQDLFDSIVDKCIGAEFDGFICDFMLKYPEFLQIHAERIEAELAKLPDPGCRELTPEETQAAWEKLCERIRAKFGEDAI